MRAIRARDVRRNRKGTLTMKLASHPIVIALALGAVSILGAAAHAQGGELHHTAVPGYAITWAPAPPSLPPARRAASCWAARRRRGRSCSASNSPPGSSWRRIATRRTSSSRSSRAVSRLGPARSWIARQERHSRRGASFTFPPECRTTQWRDNCADQRHGAVRREYVDPKDDPRTK